MLDQQTPVGLESDLKLHPEMADADWCVGDAPGRWDISFTDRLWLTFRRWFARHAAETTVTLRVTSGAVADRERRKAA